MQNSFEMETEAYKQPLVDGHAHLEELDDLPKSLQEAKEAGVCGILAVGMDIESNKKILQIAEANTRYVYPALGYHPWQIKDEEVEAEPFFHSGSCGRRGGFG